MKNKRKISWLIWPAIVFMVFCISLVRAQVECGEHPPVSFTEDFKTDEFKDHAWSSVHGWPSRQITLDWLGANFEIQPLSTGLDAQIYVAGAGDFDGDGLPDLIGLDVTNNDRLILIRNHFEDVNGDRIDDDGIVFQIDDPVEVYDDGLAAGPASLSVADYNGDGLLDFFFLKNELDEFGYSGFVAAMYINEGTATDPHFNSHMVLPSLDFTSAFMSAGIYCNWRADHLYSVDIDQDGDVDVLVISEDKIFLVRNPGPGDFDLSHFTVEKLNYDLPTGFTGTRGGSSIGAGDFDRDGDIDVIGGTVDDLPFLVYYDNDGTGYFTRREIPIPQPECTGPVVLSVNDFTGDGLPDIFGATDLWDRAEPPTTEETRVWIFKNEGVDTASGLEVSFSFSCLNGCLPLPATPHDAVRLDYDGDGDLDVIMLGANELGEFYVVRNDLADVFVLAGEARSTDVAGSLDPQQYAVTRVRLTDIRQRVIGGSSQGLQIELFVSSNGRDWELYTRFVDGDIRNQSGLPWHTFNHFGSQLYWKALLTA